MLSDHLGRESQRKDSLAQGIVYRDVGMSTGNYLNYINWGWKIHPLWAALFPTLGSSKLNMSVHTWTHSFSLFLAMDITWCFKFLLSWFSYAKLLLWGYFLIATGNKLDTLLLEFYYNLNNPSFRLIFVLARTMQVIFRLLTRNGKVWCLPLKAFSKAWRKFLNVLVINWPLSTFLRQQDSYQPSWLLYLILLLMVFLSF